MLSMERSLKQRALSHIRLFLLSLAGRMFLKLNRKKKKNELHNEERDAM